MNGIVSLKHIEDYKKVCYYSVCIKDESEFNDSSESLFEAFIREQEKTENEKLNHILAWVKEIGDQYGAKERFFRHEQNQGEAMGLPPNKIGSEPVYTEDGEISPNNLRLYCHRLNDNVVILFSGGLKTADTPQECPNVKPHFKLANKLTVIIDEAFKNKDIFWVDEFNDIDYSDDLTLYL
ncbi:hypothetical protein [Ichthyenterobacterium magnum]|uniref:Uncharacterized protein n=1 Tax=Ichthyenterobacterium magnum TaxID=1230530 RepID=A0A420DGX2_9FLAO|nr:hypothetical protein [Ichthyenterobacterium magnum]RKE92334.1 hypothetical protein BXY80_2253 [Ichthyenterobacterium magnum]